jgi:hypothetical protein
MIAYDKTIALENYFRTNYSYSLAPEIKNSERHLEEFIFDSRAGHCEYFATAMTVMLRIIGIPARIVSGFYTSEWNNYEGYYIVREQNAHSWVEAWMDSEWITFDPTPSQSLPGLLPKDTLFTPILHFLDSVKFKWYRYVIDYSSEDQDALRKYFATGIKAIKKFFDPLRNMIAMFTHGSDAGGLNYLNRRMFVLFILFFAGLLTIVALMLRDESRRRRIASSARQAKPHRLTVEFYEKVLKALSLLGHKRPPSQTPREFAYTLSSFSNEFAGIKRLTELYYRVRYNSEKLDSSDAQFADNLAQKLHNLAKHHKATHHPKL